MAFSLRKTGNLVTAPDRNHTPDSPAARYIVCFEQHRPPSRFGYGGQVRRKAMSLVRLLGFRTLTCGCVIGRYRELATSREVSYVEEKGPACEMYGHRRNHTISSERATLAPEPLSAIRAS